MDPRRRSLAAILLAILLLLAGPQPRARGDERVDVAEIVASVGRRAVEQDQVVGLSIGVARGDAILEMQGFGLANVELNVPATAETVYRIGSITKQFTAAAILLLVEEGKLTLDDPLSTYLPDYPQHAAQVTIRHLLEHTSGIKSFTGLPNYRVEQPDYVSQEDVIDRFQHLPLEFEPGEKHSYCNSGYFLLAVVVEKVSGEYFPKFLQERVFDTLHLEHTYCDSHSQVIPQRADGYTRWSGVVRNAAYINLKQTIGAGNLAATVGDLLRWQQALAANRLLSAESSQQMNRRGQLNDGTSIDYGLGVGLRRRGNRQVIRHGGGINGFRADLTYYPASGYMIVVLANSENAKASRISDRLADRLLEAVPNEEVAK